MTINDIDTTPFEKRKRDHAPCRGGQRKQDRKFNEKLQDAGRYSVALGPQLGFRNAWR